jgi:hypothetical protein
MLSKQERDNQFFASYLRGVGSPEWERVKHIPREHFLAPTTPQYMELDARAKLNDKHSEERRQINLTYFGGWSTPSSHQDGHNALKRLEESIKQETIELEERIQKYKEELYPKQKSEYDFEEQAIQFQKQERIRQKQIQWSVSNKDTDWHFREIYEKEKLRRQLQDPEWERLQLEIEKKKIAIRMKAEQEMKNSFSS